MKKERKEENEAYKETKADDLAAIDLLQKASDAMLAYYKKNDIDSAVPEGSKFLAEPKFDRGDLAPDAKFSDKGKRGTQMKGIAQLLNMIKEDLEGEVVAGIKN